MKLKPIKRKELKQSVEVQKEEPKQKTGGRNNKMPKDGYTPMFPPVRILVRECPSYKDPTKMVKQYIEFSVKRVDDDEAPACCYMQMYQESEIYTGYLKGKNIHFPIEMFTDVVEALNDMDEECEKRHIEY